MISTSKITKQNLPTSISSYKYPVHRWFHFIAGYSPEFVSDCIQSVKLKHNSVVIDPFSGLSTTLVQSMLNNINSVGFEPHPFFYDISIAKTKILNNPKTVNEIKEKLLKIKPVTYELSQIWPDHALTYLLKLIPEKKLRILANAMLETKEYDTNKKYLYRLIVSRVLELCSGSKTDGIYKAPTSLKKSNSYVDAVTKICTLVLEDINIISNLKLGGVKLFNRSSENMSKIKDKSCDLCITSPPYLNNFDYAEMTRMEFYFWRYASNWSDITNIVRSKLVVNTTTVPGNRKDRGNYRHNLPRSISAILNDIVDQLKLMQKIKPGKKDYYSLVIPYFSQMQVIIRNLRRVLKPNSISHWIIGDSALYGVHIKTHEILSLIMQSEGFKLINIENLRKRGERWILSKRQGSANGLGEFDIVMRRI